MLGRNVLSGQAKAKHIFDYILTVVGNLESNVQWETTLLQALHIVTTSTTKSKSCEDLHYSLSCSVTAPGVLNTSEVLSMTRNLILCPVYKITNIFGKAAP
jgi:hypothetical protein